MVAAFGSAIPLAGADVDTAVRKWAVRSDAMVVNQRGTSSDGVFAAGITFQRRLWQRYEWEETLAFGVGNRQADGGGLGLVLAGTGRGAVWISQDQKHTVALGLGTALAVGGGYRALNFAFGELAYQLRSETGWCVLIALGPSLLMNKPSGDVCAKSPWFCRTFEQRRFDPWGHARLGVGLLF